MKRISTGILISEGDQIGDVKTLMAGAIDRLDNAAFREDKLPDWTTLEVSSRTDFSDDTTFSDARVANSVYTTIDFTVRAL